MDENAIELSTEMKYDYLRFRFIALNEDFEFALSILSDITSEQKLSRILELVKKIKIYEERGIKKWVHGI